MESIINNFDEDKYLNFIYKLISEKRIYKKNYIEKIVENKPINRKDIILKKQKINFSIIKINLENNMILLINDLPINHLLSESILIGDKTDLYSFKFKKENSLNASINKTFLSSKEILDLFKKEIDTVTVKIENPWDFNNLNFTKNFIDIEIISIFKEFALEKAKVNLNKIHIIDSNKIENFLPNTKKKHIEISNNLSIPLIKTVENGYIKDSNINILDINSQNNLLNPLFEFQKEIMWEVDKNSNQKVFNNRDYNIYFKIKKDELLNSLDKKHKNFNLDSFKKKLDQLNSIKLNSLNSDLPLPLFEAKSGFFKIKDKNDFKILSGINFKLDSIFLKNIYLQGLAGTKATFQNKFLRKELINFFQINNLDKDNVKTYKNIISLILDFEINNFNEKTNILFNEDISKHNLFELKQYIKKLIEKTVIISIKNNKIPTYSIPVEIIERYLSSKVNILNSNFEEYKINLNKNILLKNTLFEIRELFKVLKQNKINFEDIYFLSEIILVLINQLNEYEPKSSKYLSDLFHSYFKNTNIEFKKSRIDINLTRIVETITLANILSKKNKIYIYFLENIEKQYLKLISKKVKILTIEPKFIEYKKPNKKKINEIFKYNKNEIISQVLKNKSNIININNKKRILSDEFIIIHRKYTNYKLISKQKKILLFQDIE